MFGSERDRTEANQKAKGCGEIAALYIDNAISDVICGCREGR
jgi:hypothetical protein